MTDTSVIVNEFNKILLQFLKEGNILCERMESSAIKATDLIKLDGILHVEPEFGIKIYMKYVQIYKDKIDANDFSVIDSVNVKKINLSSVMKASNINKYIAFSKLFKKLNPDNKNTLFEYLRVLCGLCLKYAEATVLTNNLQI